MIVVYVFVVLLFCIVDSSNGVQKSSISYRYLKAIPTPGFYTPGGIYSGNHFISYYYYKLFLSFLSKNI